MIRSVVRRLVDSAETTTAADVTVSVAAAEAVIASAAAAVDASAAVIADLVAAAVHRAARAAAVPVVAGFPACLHRLSAPAKAR